MRVRALWALTSLVEESGDEVGLGGFFSADVLGVIIEYMQFVGEVCNTHPAPTFFFFATHNVFFVKSRVPALNNLSCTVTRHIVSIHGYLS